MGSLTTIIETKDPLLKRILIVDDEVDVTLSFGLEGYYYYQDNERRMFELYTYNNPAIAISEFKPNFYDLLLTDIFMPKMNGLELYEKIVEIDPNIRVCFMSSAEIKIEALMEVYPKVSFGCFIKKPIEILELANRIKQEIEL